MSRYVGLVRDGVSDYVADRVGFTDSHPYWLVHLDLVR
jgi:hypothetical protein